MGSPTCIIGEVGSPESPGGAGAAGITAGLAAAGLNKPIKAIASAYGKPGSTRGQTDSKVFEFYMQKVRTLDVSTKEIMLPFTADLEIVHLQKSSRLPTVRPLWK